LLYQGEGNTGKPFLMGLIDTQKLKNDAKKEPLQNNKEPSEEKKEHSSSPLVAARSPLGSSAKNVAKPEMTGFNGHQTDIIEKRTSGKNSEESHRNEVTA